jgi:thioredoxin reductase
LWFILISAGYAGYTAGGHISEYSLLVKTDEAKPLLFAAMARAGCLGKWLFTENYKAFEVMIRWSMEWE